MKKLAITAALVALGSISASAADLGARPYTKAPVMISAASSVRPSPDHPG